MDDATRALLVKALHDAAEAIEGGAELMHYNIGGQSASGDLSVSVALRKDMNRGPEAAPEGTELLESEA